MYLVDFPRGGEGLEGVLVTAFVKAGVTDMDGEFQFGGKGHPLEAEIALNLKGFEMAREHGSC